MGHAPGLATVQGGRFCCAGASGVAEGGAWWAPEPQASLCCAVMKDGLGPSQHRPSRARLGFHEAHSPALGRTERRRPRCFLPLRSCMTFPGQLQQSTKNNRNLLSHGFRSQKSEIKGLPGHVFSKSPKEALASSSPWWLPAILSIPGLAAVAHSFWPHGHMAPSLRVHFLSSCKDTSHWTRAHLNPA